MARYTASPAAGSRRMVRSSEKATAATHAADSAPGRNSIVQPERPRSASRASIAGRATLAGTQSASAKTPPRAVSKAVSGASGRADPCAMAAAATARRATGASTARRHRRPESRPRRFEAPRMVSVLGNRRGPGTAASSLASRMANRSSNVLTAQAPRPLEGAPWSATASSRRCPFVRRGFGLPRHACTRRGL